VPTDMDNPFVILSYIAGPALLTNATSLLTLATTNRFARAVDRARYLLGELAEAGPELEPILRRDLEASQRRAKVIARAMAGLYLAAGMFALATMLSVVGGVLSQLGVTTGLGVDIAAAAVAGAVGFAAFVTAALALIEESRLALRALTLEAREVDVRLAAARP
jgi:hypothetical protein